jgi:hypothetical protein
LHATNKKAWASKEDSCASEQAVLSRSSLLGKVVVVGLQLLPFELLQPSYKDISNTRKLCSAIKPKATFRITLACNIQPHMNGRQQHL